MKRFQSLNSFIHILCIVALSMRFLFFFFNTGTGAYQHNLTPSPLPPLSDRQSYDGLEKRLKEVFSERSSILHQLSKTSKELDSIKGNLQVGERRSHVWTTSGIEAFLFFFPFSLLLFPALYFQLLCDWDTRDSFHLVFNQFAVQQLTAVKY